MAGIGLTRIGRTGLGQMSTAAHAVETMLPTGLRQVHFLPKCPGSVAARNAFNKALNEGKLEEAAKALDQMPEKDLKGWKYALALPHVLEQLQQEAEEKRKIINNPPTMLES